MNKYIPSVDCNDHVFLYFLRRREEKRREKGRKTEENKDKQTQTYPGAIFK